MFVLLMKTDNLNLIMDNTIKYTLLYAFLFIMGALIVFSYKSSANEVKPVGNGCFTSYAETKNIVLNDETKVKLRPGSILLYPEKFAEDNKSVHLKGEAIFNVSADEVPFIVNSGNICVEACASSSFAINSFSNDSVVSIIPYQGVVKLMFNDGGLGKALPVNVRTEINNYTGDVAFFRTAEYKNELYKKDCLVFQNERLENIVNTLIRNYNIDLNYDYSKYRNGRYTVTFFPYSSSSEAVDILCNITGIEVF